VVIGAGDGEVDGGAGGAVAAVLDVDGEVVRHAGTTGQRIGVAVQVVERVAHHAGGGGQRRGAVGAGLGVGHPAIRRRPAVAGQRRAIVDRGVAGVGIGLGQRNGGAGRAGGGNPRLHQLRALRPRRHRRVVIGAGDGEVDGGAGGAVAAVLDVDGEVVRHAGTTGQRIGV